MGKALEVSHTIFCGAETVSVAEDRKAHSRRSEELEEAIWLISGQK